MWNRSVEHFWCAHRHSIAQTVLDIYMDTASATHGYNQVLHRPWTSRSWHDWSDQCMYWSMDTRNTCSYFVFSVHHRQRILSLSDMITSERDQKNWLKRSVYRLTSAIERLFIVNTRKTLCGLPLVTFIVSAQVPLHVSCIATLLDGKDDILRFLNLTLTWWSSFRTHRPHFLQWCARGALKPSQTLPRYESTINIDFLFKTKISSYNTASISHALDLLVSILSVRSLWKTYGNRIDKSNEV
jgi:hypothetical protein